MDIQQENANLKSNTQVYLNKVYTLKEEVSNLNTIISISQQNCEVYKNNYQVWQNNYATAKNSLEKSKQNYHNLSLDLNSIKELRKVDKAKRVELEQKYQKEMETSDHYYALFWSVEKKIEKLRESYIYTLKQRIVGSNADYKNLMNYTVEKFESLLQCPISWDKFDKPVILPSGEIIPILIIQKHETIIIQWVKRSWVTLSIKINQIHLIVLSPAEKWHATE